MEILRRDFLKYYLGSAVALGLELTKLGSLREVFAAIGNAAPLHPIDSNVFTTLQKTVLPDSPSSLVKLRPNEISKYKKNGYGIWHYGSGLEFVKRLDLLPTSYSGASKVDPYGKTEINVV